MEIAIIAAASSFLGVIIGGVISYYLQKQQLAHTYKLKLEENKTVNIAEDTVKYYLKDEGFIERSFEHLKTKLGGFKEDELRRVLVRAGAVRFIRKVSQEEYWCLVSRLSEKYEKDRKKNK